MRAADKEIAEILARYDEPMEGSTWVVQGNRVIYHKALERIAARAGIEFEKPQIVRSEADEAVILVCGLGPKPNGGGPSKMEWSFGEAKLNVNYRVSGKQAAYLWSMAEKRAKDRVILKLIGLHGELYSEEEADNFKEASHELTYDAIARSLRKSVDLCTSPGAVTTFMREPETEGKLANLPDVARHEVKAYAKERLIALGWKPKASAQS